jgi:hypothetical protein
MFLVGLTSDLTISQNDICSLEESDVMRVEIVILTLLVYDLKGVGAGVGRLRRTW